MKECQADLCDGIAYVLATRRSSSRGTRRCFRCKKCGHVWAELNGEKPKSAAPENRLPDDVILSILTDTSPHHIIALKHQCSQSTVSKIRRGELHPSVHPEIARIIPIPRAGRKSCKKCIHYTGMREYPCDLGHKDPVEEGLTFAYSCSNFDWISK